MLVIFAGVPVAAPGETMFNKEAVTQVILINFIGKILAPVRIDFAAGGRDIGIARTSFVVDYIGIIEGIDINGEAIGVFGQAGSAVNHPVVKTGCVIVCHGSRVIAIIFVYQPNPLNLIVILYSS